MDDPVLQVHVKANPFLRIYPLKRGLETQALEVSSNRPVFLQVSCRDACVGSLSSVSFGKKVPDWG